MPLPSVQAATDDPEGAVPPQQCPECGRFLKKAFVAGLSDGPAPCPRCAVSLTAAMFDLTGSHVRVVDAAASDEPPVDGTPPEPEPSVRPPDLSPETVREAEVDVLAGWDVGADADEVASWRADQRPFPTDTVVVVGAGALGAVLGAVLAREGRGRGAVGGVLLGVLAAAIARRVWRLSP
jgi:hypothetical protein